MLVVQNQGSDAPPEGAELNVLRYPFGPSSDFSSTLNLKIFYDRKQTNED